MAFENFSSVNNFDVKPVQQLKSTQQPNQQEEAVNPEPDKQDHKKLYAALGALAVIGTTCAIIYKFKKGQGIKPQTGGGKPPVTHDTPPVRLNGSNTEQIRHILPKKFTNEAVERAIGAKKFYSLKAGEIPQGYKTKTEIGDKMVYDYGNRVTIEASKNADGVRELVLKHSETNIGKISFDSATGNIRKSTFKEVGGSDIEICYNYDKNNKYLSYQEIKDNAGRVRTTTILADGSKSVIEKDKNTLETTLEEYYDKDGHILSCKMDGEDVVIGDDIPLSSSDYAFNIEKPNNTGVTFRRGIAIGKDGKIYTGVLEKTNKNGDKLVTKYDSGRVTERIYYPAKGYIKEIRTQYNNDEKFIHVRSYITNKDGSVSNKYYAKIIEKPVHDLKGLFCMSEFNSLTFDKILGHPSNIVEKNGKKIVYYPNDINIVYETSSNGSKQRITLRRHKTELRKLTFYNNGVKDIWLDNHTSIGIKNGEFYHYKKITNTENGGYISERTFADATSEKTVKDSNNTTISSVRYDAYGQTI
ncbi:hypothetical protein IKP85_03885 [bacterium]|nr:hypothetical protein [bacterium]